MHAIMSKRKRKRRSLDSNAGLWSERQTIFYLRKAGTQNFNQITPALLYIVLRCHLHTLYMAIRDCKSHVAMPVFVSK